MKEMALSVLRQTFELYVARNEILPLSEELPEELSKADSGTYVAAFENPGRKPRGRVGSYMPTKSSLAEEIQFRAIELADTFPFRKQDLPFLVYEIQLAKTPCLLPDIENLDALSGLLVRSDKGTTAVSLPGLKKKSPPERLKEACNKGNIDRQNESVRLYEFAIEVFNEEYSRKKS